MHLAKLKLNGLVTALANKQGTADLTLTLAGSFVGQDPSISWIVQNAEQWRLLSSSSDNNLYLQRASGGGVTNNLVFDVIDDRGSDSGELLDRVLNFIYNCRNDDKCKEAFLLNRYFGLKYKDIAKKMGVNEFRIASRVFNVQQKLKQFKRA